MSGGYPVGVYRGFMSSGDHRGAARRDGYAAATIEATLRVAWGRSVAVARHRAGLSQAELARRCGVTQQAVSKIERGRSVPADGLKARLACALGSSPGALFAWPDADADGDGAVQRSVMGPYSSGRR